MRIGLDLRPMVIAEDLSPVFRSMAAIKYMQKTDKHQIWMICQADDDERVDILNWLAENNFWEASSALDAKLYFVYDKRDKATLARALYLNAFIDTDQEVLDLVSRQVKSDKKPIRTYHFQTWNQVYNDIRVDMGQLPV